MKTRTGTLAVLTAALACTPAYAAPAKVNVRVEGATHTIFEGAVTTDGHSLTKDSSGPHPCDGTNAGAFPDPGPTATAALDDAATKGGFDWSASWNDNYQDFLVNGIGPDNAAGSKFWGFAVNGEIAPAGGCQTRVESGDDVLFYYGSGAKYILRATGRHKVRAGRRFHVKVIAAQTTFDSSGKASTTFKPIAGARIGGKKTNANGIVTLRYRHRGVKRIKARRANSVRSNQLRVKVVR